MEATCLDCRALMELVNHGYGEDHHADGNQRVLASEAMVRALLQVRQSLSNSSKPFIGDEMESNNMKFAEQIEQILNLVSGQ